MSNNIRVNEFKEPTIELGEIIGVDNKNITGNWYLDDRVEFIVFGVASGGVDLIGLAVISGNKSGLVYLILPEDACAANGRGIKREWLIENWTKWIYPDGDVKNGYIRKKFLEHDWFSLEKCEKYNFSRGEFARFSFLNEENNYQFLDIFLIDATSLKNNFGIIFISGGNKGKGLFFYDESRSGNSKHIPICDLKYFLNKALQCNTIDEVYVVNSGA